MDSKQNTAALEQEQELVDDVCLTFKSFLLSWGRALSETDRARLVEPLIEKCLGTRNDGKRERRQYMALDWYIRVHTPTWLEHIVNAQSLLDLSEIVDLETAKAAGKVVSELDSVPCPSNDIGARDAAWLPAWRAEETCGGRAARDASWTLHVASDTKWGDAWGASKSAAKHILLSGGVLPIERLQQSSRELVLRMCAA